MKSVFSLLLCIPLLLSSCAQHPVNLDETEEETVTETEVYEPPEKTYLQFS